MARRPIVSWCVVLGLLGSVTAARAQDPNPPLVAAAKSQDRAAVARLLAGGVKPDVAALDGGTALQWAAYWDDLELVNLLLDKGASANTANELGMTPLLLSAMRGGGAIIERLLRAGADANRSSLVGETPLMFAARAGSAAGVQALLRAGANVNAAEPTRGQTALMWAAAEGHSAAVRALVEGGANVNAQSTRGFTPLLFAAGGTGDVEAGKILIAAGADVNYKLPDYAGDLTEASWLAAAGDYEALHVSGAGPLVVAALGGRTAFGLLLLDSGANPNASDSGYTALHAAVLRGDLALAKALVAKGGDVNAKITRAFRRRVFSLDTVIMPSWIGGTPLWLAARFAEADILRVLADAGADPFVSNTGTSEQVPTNHPMYDFQSTPPQTTALMAAAGLGWANSQDRRGRNATGTGFLADGDALGSVKIVYEMAERRGRGADVLAEVNSSGETALFGAARHALLDVVQFLVEKGADINARNKRGQTPLQAARGSSAPAQVLEAMVKLGARDGETTTRRP